MEDLAVPSAPAPSAPAGLDPGAEPRPLSPRLRTVWRASALFWAGVWTVVWGLLAVAAVDARVFFAALAGLGLLGGVAGFLLPGMAWSRWSYRILPDALELEHGILTWKRSTVPYYRVQHIDLRSGPLERRLDLTRLVVRTASASSDAELPGIATGDADELRAYILERAGRDDAV